MGAKPARPRFSAEWLTAVLDSLTEGVIALDGEGRVHAGNPAAERLLGFDLTVDRHTHWTRLAWAHLVDEEGVPLRPHPIEQLLADGRPTAPRVVGLDTRDGVRWLTLATHRIASEDVADRGVVVSFQDVTDRVEAEHERHRLLDVLRDVLSATTHDLRTPLTAVHAYAAVLLEQGDDETEREEALQAILRQTSHLSRLVSDLSVVAGLEAGHVDPTTETVSVLSVVRAVVEASAAGRDIVVDVPADLHVHVDGSHARRMLSNLVDNAFKYGAPPIELCARRDGSEVVVSVIDHGEGVPESFVPSLFDRFTRARPAGGASGSGLGLAIVWGLADRNHGSVDYVPSDDGRPRFELRLPAASVPAAAEARTPPAHAARPEPGTST